jgi:hypothetical protein
MKRAAFGISGVACALALSFSPEAQALGSAPASCTFYTDNSGYCSGTLAGFHNSTSGNYIVFQEYASTNSHSRYVAVNYNGTYKFLPIYQSQTHIWNAFNAGAAIYNANIYVHWDTAGAIDAVQFYNSSGYYRGN